MCQTTTLMSHLPFRPFRLFMPVRAIAVSGDSMLPTYLAGDWLIFAPAGSSERLLGKVVVVERESYPGILLIKRVTHIDLLPNGAYQFWVEGDNRDASTDSRHWGAISRSEIRGRIVLRYKRSQRSK